jgi:hypothetical protein
MFFLQFIAAGFNILLGWQVQAESGAAAANTRGANNWLH